MAIAASVPRSLNATSRQGCIALAANAAGTRSNRGHQRGVSATYRV